MKGILAMAVAGLGLATVGTGERGEQPSVRVTGSFDIPGKAAGTRIRELSGLAYNPASNILWAVSDRGTLHEFSVQFKKGVPAGVRHLRAAKLGLAFTSAEGLSYAPPSGAGGKGHLLIAFEDGPSIVSLPLAGGARMQLPLPPPLDDPLAYAEDNSRLEAVAAGPDRGFFTAPEEALKDRPDTEHTIFASDSRTVRIPGFQAHRSNLKAMEYLADVGKLLILERTRDDAGVSTMRLRLVDLNACPREGVCPVTELMPDKPASFVGNFEGLTRLKGNYFAAVADSNPKHGETTRIVFFAIGLSGKAMPSPQPSR